MSTKPMNLLYIFSDQHSREKTGCYGNQYVKTPNIDRLSREGTQFNNAYCNFPICLPSRASMTVGDYAHRNNYWDNAHPYAGEAEGWGHRLTQQGFEVTTIGKLHYKANIPETGFLDQRIPLNTVKGIGDIYGCVRSKDAFRPELGEWIAKATIGEHDYTRYDRQVASLAKEFLEGKTPSYSEKPWTLFVGFVCPHFPLICPSEFAYDPMELPFPKQYLKGSRPEHPVIAEFRRYCNLEDDLDEMTVRKAVACYYGLCSFMDAQVGIVIDALRKANLEDTTRIIYTCDHGDTMGDHGLWYKHTMYEGSVGVPLIIAGPDIPKGKKSNTNVSLVDIFPTVLECVGATPRPEDTGKPGESLIKFANEDDVPDRIIFSEYHAVGSITGIFMIRTKTYKYVYYVGYDPQLFNLEKDPDEFFDLAQDPEYKDVLDFCETELRKICDPEEVDKKCKKDQIKLVDLYGGKTKILELGQEFAYSPVPE
jgi:choline-sulfatase